MFYSIRYIDLAIILVYLLTTAIIPIYVSRKQKNKEDFIMAGRSMHWFPLALAGVAAGFSAISLLGVPGFVLAHNLKYLPTLFVGFLSIPVVFFVVVPFLYKLRLVSVYEYLERRFCPAIRYAASGLFMISKLGYLSMAIYTPALALNSITGLPIMYYIVILGVFTTIYNMLGGLKGVVWSDVLQYFIIIAGISGVVCFFLGHDFSRYWQLASEAGKTETFDFSVNFSSLTIWVLFLNCTIMGIAGICSDQSAVQRLLAARSMKDSMKSYLFTIVFGTPIVLILYFVGICLYGFFESEGVVPAEIAGQTDKIFPYFVSRYLPAGVSGLLLSAFLAAGMSTISDVLHSLTSLFMVDIYEKISGSSERGTKYVWISRGVSLIWGSLAVALAFFVMYLGNTIIEVTQILAALLAAPLGGVFFLGIFTKTANTTGTVIGGACGIIVTVLSWYLNHAGIVMINFMWFALFGIFTTCFIGYLCSFLTNLWGIKSLQKQSAEAIP